MTYSVVKNRHHYDVVYEFGSGTCHAMGKILDEHDADDLAEWLNDDLRLNGIRWHFWLGRKRWNEREILTQQKSSRKGHYSARR